MLEVTNYAPPLGTFFGALLLLVPMLFPYMAIFHVSQQTHTYLGPSIIFVRYCVIPDDLLQCLGYESLT